MLNSISNIGSTRTDKKTGNTEPTGAFWKLVDYLNRPLYAQAGTVEYLMGKSPYESIPEAVWGGISGKRRTTYETLTGDPYSGFVLNVVGDVSTWLPWGVIPKAIKATKIPAGIGMAVAAIGNKVPKLQEAATLAKNLISKGFIDAHFPLKQALGMGESISKLRELGISDDIIKLTAGGHLTDDLLRTIPKEAAQDLKKVSQIGSLTKRISNIPNQKAAIVEGAIVDYEKLYKFFGGFETKNPKVAESFVNMIETSLPENIAGRWGMGKAFLDEIENFVPRERINEIINSVERPMVEVAVKTGEQIPLFPNLGLTADAIKIPNAANLDEFAQLVDEATKNMSPQFREILKKHSYVNGELKSELLQRRILTEQMLTQFANDLGIEHVEHIPLEAMPKFLEKHTIRMRATIEDKLNIIFSNIEKNIKASGISPKLVDEYLTSIKPIFDKIKSQKIMQIIEGSEVEKLGKEIWNLSVKTGDIGIKKLYYEYMKSAKDITSFRATWGTIKNINQKSVELAGYKIVESNLPKILFSQEVKAKIAMLYHDTLKKMADEFPDLIKRFDETAHVPSNFEVLDMKSLGKFIVHEDIAKAFERTVRMMHSGDEELNKLLRGVDKATGIWKYFTLIPFSKYHTRNLVAEMYFNSVLGMPLLSKEYNEAMKIWFGHFVRHDPAMSKKYLELMQSGAYGGFMKAEAGFHRVLGGGMRPFQHAIENIPGIGKVAAKTYGVPLEFMENVGRFTEEVPRMSLYLWASKKAASNPKWLLKFGVSSPLELVQKYHAYYGAMTSFEKKVMRRIMPFYSWTRFNVPIHISILLNKPQVFATIEKGRKGLTSALGGGEPSYYEPEYLREGYTVGFSGKTGYSNYFLLNGWLPGVDIGNIIHAEGYRDMFIQLLHPAARQAIEQAWGYNLYYKQPIPAYPGEKKILLGAKVPPRVYHLVSSIRVLQDVNKFWWGKDNPYLTRMLYLLVGRTYSVDLEQARKQYKYFTSRAISELNRGIGRAKEHKDYKTVRKLEEQVKILKEKARNL